LPIQAVPYIFILGTIYGTTLLAGRFSVGQFEPSVFIGLRLVLASLIFIIVTLLSRSHSWPRGRDLWRHSLVLGIIGTAMPMVLLVTSLKYQSSGMTAILITLGPSLTVLMAHFTLPEEPLTHRKLAGVLLAFSGAMLLMALGESGLPDVHQASPIGYLLVIVAMICSSSGTIYTRKYMQDLDTLSVNTARVLLAALLVMPLSLVFVGVDLSTVDNQGYIALGWAALAGTFLAVMISFDNIKRFGATAGAMPAYITPVVTSLGGVLLLHETITPGMLAGMALILIGITVINQRSLRTDLAAKV
jgi:drug/metabolite transporter (DMT)-like permease